MFRRIKEQVIQQAFHEWWKAQTLVGDPARRPHLTEDAFEAGYLAARNTQDAAADLFRAIALSDDAHWTPAMRAAMARATGATLWDHDAKTNAALNVRVDSDMLALLLRIRDSYPGYIPDFIEDDNAVIAKAEAR